MLIIAPIIYRIRNRKLLIINPISTINNYNKTEKTLLTIGTILALTGLLSIIVIAKYFGYYYFDNGVPTFLKR